MNTLESAKINDLEICMKILNDGKMFQREQGFIPVSYTHLDVYKRQICSCFQAFIGSTLSV